MNDESLQTAGDETANAADVAESNAEAEQLRTENEELRTAIRMRDTRDVIVSELTAMGAASPELLFASIQGEIQFDGDDKPANVAALAANLKQKFPEQFAIPNPASIDAGTGGGNQHTFLTREALAKMKPVEIARLDWNDVRQALAN